MSRKEKLLQRFLKQPKDFTFDEMVNLLGYLGYKEVKTGKTSGSRVRFENENLLELPLLFHKPHPGNILKSYQIKSILNDLINYGLIKTNENGSK